MVWVKLRQPARKTSCGGAPALYPEPDYCVTRTTGISGQMLMVVPASFRRRIPASQLEHAILSNKHNLLVKIAICVAVQKCDSVNLSLVLTPSACRDLDV